MKYRKSADQAIAKSSEVLDEDSIRNEMSVAEWLDRLNLRKYYHRFQKEKIIDVKDLRFVNDEGKLESHFQIKNLSERQRIISMMNNEKITKEDFAFLTINQVRTMV